MALIHSYPRAIHRAANRPPHRYSQRSGRARALGPYSPGAEGSTRDDDREARPLRPGDYITVNGSEVEVLTSETFKHVATDELLREMRLTDDPERADYQRLSLPRIGRPVAAALRVYAGAAPPADAVVAEHLAERIEGRIGGLAPDAGALIE